MYDQDNTETVKAEYEYVKRHYSEESVTAYFAQQFCKKGGSQ